MITWFMEHSLTISAWLGLGATVFISMGINILSWRRDEI